VTEIYSICCNKHNPLNIWKNGGIVNLTMSKYEYKIKLKDYKNHSLASDKEESDFLNEYGELGWELVSVVYENMVIDTQPSFLMRYYFKKKIED